MTVPKTPAEKTTGKATAPATTLAAKTEQAAAQKEKVIGALSRFLQDDADPRSLRYDESDMYPKHKNLVRLVMKQSLSILVLVLLMVAGEIFLQPINTYFMRLPGKEKKSYPLIALTEPNLTDQAVLSWVVTSISEILTIGFGDMDKHVIAQHHRFTPDGWESFINTLRERNLREDFKMRQLVLTTVPANSPVIVGKGVDEDGDYTWIVEMPIIMTYATNNNKQSIKKSIVRVTIARMPSLENKAGMGIKMWKML